ncbi:hypothetical protein GCM10027047_15860 [Rhodococcus aerolatus]
MSTTSTPGGPPTGPATTRGLLVALAVGALLVAAALTLTTGRPGTSSTAVASSPLAATGSVPRTGAVSGSAFATATAGTCLTWAAADLSDLAQVPCTEPHLVEVAGSVDLARYPGTEFGPSAPFPGTVRLTQLRDEVCEPVAQDYLDGRLDPYGLYSVGLVNPGEAAWAAGERTLRCGLQQAGRTGTLTPVVGRVADLDQSDVTAVGTCAGIEATLPGDPVDCSAAHASETIAVVDLAGQVPGDPPSDADQDKVLEAACTKASDDYTGAPGGAAAAKLTVFWDDVRPASWLAGSTRVNCYVGQQLAGGGFAPLTGSARAGGTPAAPPAAPAPGAPGTTTTPGTTATPGATATPAVPTTTPAPATTPAATTTPGG